MMAKQQIQIASKKHSKRPTPWRGRVGSPALLRQCWGGVGGGGALGGTPQGCSPRAWGRQDSFSQASSSKGWKKTCQFIAKRASAPAKPVEEAPDPTLQKKPPRVTVYVCLYTQTAQGSSGFCGQKAPKSPLQGSDSSLHRQQVHPAGDTAHQRWGC